MKAFTIGVTTARYPECKRGLATNIAASLARLGEETERVCVVDADPHALDVTTRLAARGPVLEDFGRPTKPPVCALTRVGSPPMAVLPCGGGSPARIHLGADAALELLAEEFSVVVCDLPGGPSGPGHVLGARLEALDVLVLAVTPQPAAVAATSHFLELFRTAISRGDVGPVRLAVVCTGDEGSAVMESAEVSSALAIPVSGRIPQLWGRSEPNRGFGAALAIPELDDAVGDLVSSWRASVDRPDCLLAI